MLWEQCRNLKFFYCSGPSGMWSSYDNRCSGIERPAAHARSNATWSPSHPAFWRRTVAIRSQSSRKEKVIRFISRQSVRWNWLRTRWQWNLLEWRIYWRVSNYSRFNIIAFMTYWNTSSYLILNFLFRYTKPLVASASLSDQKYNPEVTGGKPDIRVAALGDKLRQVRQVRILNVNL